MDSPKKQASKILRDKKMYQRWLAIFMCLALVVTSGTVTALKLTGQAWTGTEQVYACTYTPHQHTEQCYNAEGKLVCGYSDLVLHTHDARCYDSEGSLICTMEELEEHSHTSECYTSVKTLICGEEEHEAIPAHTHTEECYTTEVTEEKVLTCGLNEGEGAVEAQPAVEGHTHTDACYTTETVVITEAGVDEEGNEIPAVTEERRTLTCGLEESEGQPAVEAVPGHVHTEECYTTQQVEKQVLTCGLEEHDEEIPAHHHSDECYTTEMVLNCDKPELIAHEHTDDCYEIELDEDGNEISRTLTCGMQQLVAHQHTDECFTEVALEAEGTYCGKEAHKHSGSCYMEVNGELVLTCDKEEHVHTDECFVEPVLYCGKQEHTHTDECYQRDENGEFVLDENGEKILICELEEHTHTEACYVKPEAVEVTETVANRFYNVELTAAYTGALAEGDELAITAATVGQDEMESDRDYEYTSKVTDSKILPLGRTEFVLTKNGEEVDRSEYAITATITPSRESVAYLVMGQGGGADSMMLDEGGEDAGQTLPVQSGFTVYELADGQLAAKGYSELALDGFDWDAYMAEAYDEQGNPAYDEALAIHAHLDGSDFMLASGVEEEVIEKLASSSESNQGNWEGGRVWWDGFKQNGKGYVHDAADHVQRVTLTHMSGADGVTDQNPVEVFEGAGEHAGDTNQMLHPNPDGADLTKIYPDATGERGNVVCPIGEAENLYVRYEGRWNIKEAIVEKGSSDWDTVVKLNPGDNWKNHGEIIAISGEKGNSINGANYAEFAQLEITTEPGYYVESVIITCFNYSTWNPYECSILTSGEKDAVFHETFAPSAKGSVTTTVESKWFGHGGSSTPNYYILIRTAAIPSPLFVTYDPGNLGDTFTAGNVTWLTEAGVEGGRLNGGEGIRHEGKTDEIFKTGDEWTAGDLTYTVAGITPEAAAGAKAAGYRFAGWKVEYFNEAQTQTQTQNGHWEYGERSYYYTGYYHKNGDSYVECNSSLCQFFELREHYGRRWVNGGTSTDWTKVDKPMENGFENVRLVESNGNVADNVAAFSTLKLLSHARLTAQWEPLPPLTVTKQVTGLEAGDKDTTDRPYTFKLEKQNGEQWDTEKEFTITVKGQHSASVDFELEDGTYRVTEVKVEGDEAKTTYALNNGPANAEPVTFTVNRSLPPKDRHQDVLVVNDYEKPKGQMVKILKVDASEKNWSPLAGAEFTLTGMDSNKQPIVIPEGILKTTTEKDGIVVEGMLPVGTYTLTETTAPDNYKKLEGTLTFEVTAETVTVTNDEQFTKTVAGASPLNEDQTDKTKVTGYEIRVKNTVAPAKVTIMKVAAGAPETGLPGAEFKLYQEVAEGTTDAEAITGTDKYGIQVGKTLTTGDDGTIAIEKGLDYNQTYYLVETKAPDGYNGLGQPIKIVYAKDSNNAFALTAKLNNAESTDAVSAKQLTPDSDVWTLKVSNSAGVEMPHTGGIGTHGFMVGGGLLMMLAAGLLILNKRRRAAEQ